MSTRDDVDVEVLTSAEVAAAFKVGPQAAARWGSSGRLVMFRTPGGDMRFFAAEIHALLAGESRERAREIGLAEQARMSGGSRG